MIRKMILVTIILSSIVGSAVAIFGKSKWLQNALNQDAMLARLQHFGIKRATPSTPSGPFGRSPLRERFVHVCRSGQRLPLGRPCPVSSRW